MAKVINAGINCPGCYGDLYNVNIERECCDKHSFYIVTVCDECHRNCYSLTPGLCENCLYSTPRSNRGLGFNKDRRAPLRKYGLE